MRSGIPADVPVANKPGSLEGVAVDAGIVYLKDRPYIFAAMSTFLDHEEQGDAAITAASRAAFDYSHGWRTLRSTDARSDRPRQQYRLK